MRTISFSQKIGFIAQNFNFYPLKTFFYPLNTCQCKLKSVSYFTVGNYNNRLKNCIKTRSFYKNWVLQLKIAILPPETNFLPGTVVKTFKMVNFVELRSFTMFYVCCRHFRVLSRLQCQNNVKKTAFFVDFFSIFIYTIHPGKKCQHFFQKIKVSLKYDRSGKFQVVYINSYFTKAF